MLDIRLINLGEYPNDPAADSIYEAFTKVNFNFEGLDDFFNGPGIGQEIRDTAAALIVNGEHVNIDVEYISVANRIDFKFNGSAIEQNLVPLGTQTLGTENFRWDAIYANVVDIDTLLVDTLSVDQVSATTVNATNATIGSTTPITQLFYNGDSSLGPVLLPTNIQLQVTGDVALKGTMAAERVDTYLDAGFF
jgi:hypothetical protein